MERTESSAKTSSATTKSYLRHRVVQSLECQESISLWRMPDGQDVHLLCTARPQVLQELTLEESAPGFIIAPFRKDQPKYWLPADELYTFSASGVSRNGKDIEPKPVCSNYLTPRFHFIHPAGKREVGTYGAFKELVQASIEAVAQGSFEKVVPSRYKEIALDPAADLLAFFDRLCSSYPTAFVSLHSTPHTGTWIGATPELLVSIDENQVFRTVALAGTQKHQPGIDLRQVSWTQKDIEEQALVSRYIINCFKKIRLREFDEHGPKTVQAGNLIHLKTEFQADMVATNFPQLGSVMLKLLHPTSAVCGMPLEQAENFLLAHEGYDRQLYAGYLGPVSIQQQSRVFVNLRCMQVLGATARVYAGAGVTIDSIPDKECEETEMKMNTLLQALQL
ncbi:MAG: chorismate-binding protein [Bacteroidota bacterium]